MLVLAEWCMYMRVNLSGSGGGGEGGGRVDPLATEMEGRTPRQNQTSLLLFTSGDLHLSGGRRQCQPGSAHLLSVEHYHHAAKQSTLDNALETGAVAVNYSSEPRYGGTTTALNGSSTST